MLKKLLGVFEYKHVSYLARDAVLHESFNILGMPVFDVNNKILELLIDEVLNCPLVLFVLELTVKTHVEQLFHLLSLYLG